MKTMLIALAALAVSASGASAHGQDHSDHAVPAAGVVEGTGVIKKIDAKSGAVTIAHDPIKALNWPAMTMSFKIADKAMLAKFKAGSKVRFDLKGQTITAIRPQ